MKRQLGASLCAAVLALSARAQSASDPLAAVNAALQAGQADQALSLLNSAPASAEAHNLRCRVLLTVENWDGAGSECQLAVNMDGQNSVEHDWLGRAFGQRAAHASFLTAYSLAKQTVAEFQTAVKLDPRNADALYDLGDYYNSAPSVVGGGADKAQSTEAQLAPVAPARADKLLAEIADGHKDYTTEESELKAAIAVDPHPALSWASLASFYRKRQEWTNLDAAIQSALTAAQKDPQASEAYFNAATVLIAANRNPQLAMTLLGDYLASSIKTEDAPAFVAYTDLAKLKAAAGDKTGASQARSAALALANEYKPAQGLKF
jgi:tetratricopeptide (TPR) repeat protein